MCRSYLEDRPKDFCGDRIEIALRLFATSWLRINSRGLTRLINCFLPSRASPLAELRIRAFVMKLFWSLSDVLFLIARMPGSTGLNGFSALSLNTFSWSGNKPAFLNCSFDWPCASCLICVNGRSTASWFWIFIGLAFLIDAFGSYWVRSNAASLVYLSTNGLRWTILTSGVSACTLAFDVV